MVPIWQPLVKCDESAQELIVLQKELFNLASKGELLIEFDHFVGILTDKLQVSGKFSYL